MSLPKKFIYLDEIDLSIKQNLRYACDENFLGYKVIGYKTNRVILTNEAAKALSSAQQDFIKDGYSIVVYDAYRPQKTVDYFTIWSRDISDQKSKERYYPSLNKEDLFKQGYVAKKSSHTRGSTVDVTIISLGNEMYPIKFSKRKLKNGDVVPFLDDGTLDMYTSFDLFNPASNHDTDLIDEEYLIKRNYMYSILSKHGFNGYHNEWWHYTLRNEPFPDTYFNFDVE